MKKIVFLLFFVMFLLPFDANALCTSQEKAKLKKMVSNINTSYDYEISCWLR